MVWVSPMLLITTCNRFASNSPWTLLCSLTFHEVAASIWPIRIMKTSGVTRAWISRLDWTGPDWFYKFSIINWPTTCWFIKLHKEPLKKWNYFWFLVHLLLSLLHGSHLTYGMNTSPFPALPLIYKAKSAFLPFLNLQASRPGSVSAEELTAEGEAPPVAVPGPALLGEPGRPAGHRQADRCHWEASQSSPYLH